MERAWSTWFFSGLLETTITINIRMLTQRMGWTPKVEFIAEAKKNSIKKCNEMRMKHSFFLSLTLWLTKEPITTANIKDRKNKTPCNDVTSAAR